MARPAMTAPRTDPAHEATDDRASAPPGIDPLRRRLLTAGAAGTAAFAALTIPNTVVDVGFFTRGVPIRWWELPVAIIAALLVATWFLIPAPRSASRHDRRPVLGAAFTALFAVGCPTCNAVMMLSLGLTGTLRYWAPVQPFLAVLCLGVLSVATVLRWRRRNCAVPGCAVGATSGSSCAEKVAS